MHHLPPHVVDLASGQAGVVSRRQLARAGAAAHDVRRWRRQRLLTGVHDGVYVLHSGPPSALEREWAAVLWAAPAALHGRSALRGVIDERGHGQVGPIHVAVDASRKVRDTAGVTVHRVVALADKARLDRSPPRMRVEEAAIEAAAACDDDWAACALIAQVISSRTTTAARVLAALQRRGRIRRREFLGELLADVADGACSVLEREYLRRVERAHGLPAADRQVLARVGGTTIYRDARYRAFGLVVELDGRLDHTAVDDRDRDLDRDLETAVEGDTTVRLGWGQVLGRACATAARLARLLQRRGWRETMTRCPDCPAAPASDDDGTFGSPADPDVPSSWLRPG